jgi:hypothetical protein
MDLDSLMNRFRLASRELFNQYFSVPKPYEHWEYAWAQHERFVELEELLFQKLVSEPASLPDVKYGYPQPNIALTLKSGDFAPIMINCEINSGYWDFPLKEIGQDAELCFTSYFDWDSIELKDNRYLLVQIRECPSHREVEGKHALIESHYVKFLQG